MVATSTAAAVAAAVAMAVEARATTTTATATATEAGTATTFLFSFVWGMLAEKLAVFEECHGCAYDSTQVLPTNQWFNKKPIGNSEQEKAATNAI